MVFSIIPIYDTENQIISYSVDFIKDNVSHGYVLIDLRMEGSYISQFSIEPGAKSLYESLADKTDIEVGENEEPYLIETFPTEYNLVIEHDDEVINTNGETFSISEFEECTEKVKPIAEREIGSSTTGNSRSTKYELASSSS